MDAEAVLLWEFASGKLTHFVGFIGVQEIPFGWFFKMPVTGKWPATGNQFIQGTHTGSPGLLPHIGKSASLT